MRHLAQTDFTALAELRFALQRAYHVQFASRGTGFGAAQEAALKLKKTMVLLAEAYWAA